MGLSRQKKQMGRDRRAQRGPSMYRFGGKTLFPVIYFPPEHTLISKKLYKRIEISKDKRV